MQGEEGREKREGSRGDSLAMVQITHTHHTDRARVHEPRFRLIRLSSRRRVTFVARVCHECSLCGGLVARAPRSDAILSGADWRDLPHAVTRHARRTGHSERGCRLARTTLLGCVSSWCALSRVRLVVCSPVRLSSPLLLLPSASRVQPRRRRWAARRAAKQQLTGRALSS